MAAELLKRLFLSEITPQLFPDNTFLSFAKNDDAFVNNNSVELPHSGTIPSVEVDRTSLPATIAKRTDAATQYLLKELTTDPTLLQDSEGLTVAYNKRASILDQHAKKINEKASNMALYDWAATGISQVLTTGAARPAQSPSATGNRNAITATDILDAVGLLNQQDVPTLGRKIIVPASMYSDMLAIPEFTRADQFGTSNIPTGMIGRVYGVDVFMRSAVTVYTGTTLKAEGATGLAADNEGAIMWHEDYVRRAVGATKIFIDNDKPEYYGTVMSAMTRFGALRARNDDKGVVAIIQVANP
jgi:hypothetical protein